MNSCAICGTTTRLIRHHTNYERNETIVLCKNCHGKVHRNKSFRPDLLPECIIYPLNIDEDLWIKFKVLVPRTKKLNDALVELVEERVSKGDKFKEAEDQMTVQPLLSTKGDGLFDLSLCTDDVIFEIIEMKAEEIRKLLKDIGDQLSLLEEAEG